MWSRGTIKVCGSSADLNWILALGYAQPVPACVYVCASVRVCSAMRRTERRSTELTEKRGHAARAVVAGTAADSDI